MTQRSEPTTDTNASHATLSVTNLGGIDTATVEFSPGVTLLTGSNATNRTSLLCALNGALGGTATTLKSDADEGHVTLTLGDDRFTRTITRTATGIERDGTPYTDAETLVDSFVTLLEDNPARRAVERGDDLHDVIMRPVDTEAIEQRIRDLRQEKQELKAERDRVEQRRNTLSRLEERRHTLQEEIASFDEDLDDLRDEVAEFEADAEAAEDAEALVDELDARRQELRSTEDDIELIESELDALRDDLNAAQTERRGVPDDSNDDRADIETELESLRDQKRQIDATISSLRTIVEFNDDFLAENGPDLPGIDPNDEAVTAALAPEETQDVVCWTCGSRVQQNAIADRLDDLRAVIEEKQDERADLTERINALEDDLQTLEQHQCRREDLDQKIKRTKEKIDQREQRLDELESTAADLSEKIRDAHLDKS